jgi:hypothetical protein
MQYLFFAGYSLGTRKHQKHFVLANLQQALKVFFHDFDENRPQMSHDLY